MKVKGWWGKSHRFDDSFRRLFWIFRSSSLCHSQSRNRVTSFLELFLWLSKDMIIFPSLCVFASVRFRLKKNYLKSLSKPRRRRQRGRGKTKDLINRTIAQHVRFKTLTFCVVCEPKPRRQIILISIWNSALLLYVMLKLRCGTAPYETVNMQPFLKF